MPTTYGVSFSVARDELSSPLQNISVTFLRTDWVDRAGGARLSPCSAAPLDHLGILTRALLFPYLKCGDDSIDDGDAYGCEM